MKFTDFRAMFIGEMSTFDFLQRFKIFFNGSHFFQLIIMSFTAND